MNMEEKLYYPVHYRDYSDGRYRAWLGTPRKAIKKPDNTCKFGEEMDMGTDWFDSKEKAIEEINTQCSMIIEKEGFEYYGESK